MNSKKALFTLITLSSLVGCTVRSGGASALYYPDSDGDGHGDTSRGVMTSTPMTGWIVNGGDCNDSNASVHPGAQEVCDDIDNDCDGVNNEGLSCGPQGCTPTTEVCNSRDDDCDGLVDDGVCGGCTPRAEICGNGVDEDCDGADDVCNPGGNCTPGATTAPDAYCRDTFCPGRGQTASHLTCNASGSWDCRCNTGGGCTPTSTVEICNNGLDDDCNGQTNEGCGGGCTVTNGGVERCDGIDNDCDGSTDEGLSCGGSGTVNVRVRCTLPGNFTGGAYGILIWNPYIHQEEAAPPGCFLSDATGRARSHECSWSQQTIDPVVFQTRYDLCHEITYCDQQSGRCAPSPQTRIWACTQEQASPETPFDAYGSCELWVDGVSRGFFSVDNASRPLYPDGPRCGNGCNFAASGFTPPSNVCTE